ncbi:MAG TPA: hypothetical protein VGO40_06415 [Longimicrobium sp.]|jgi:hypothetical protein|nr:hypothetical protein [Longimicrobium sp.]
MNRSALALLGLLALPLAAAAQNDRPLLANEPPPQQLPESKFSITPYVGARVPFNTGTAVVVTGGGTQYNLRWERGGGAMAGVDVTARVRGPFHFVGGAAYSGRRNDLVLLGSGAATVDTLTTQGAAYWFAKAGVQVRLADPNPDDRRFHPSAFITAAPAIVWTDWNDVPGFSAAANRGSHHFAANLGADAAARIGRSEQWSFTLGVQDYLVFWNTDRLNARDAAIAAAVLSQPVTVAYDYSTSNLLTLRFGISYRFR